MERISDQYQNRIIQYLRMRGHGVRIWMRSRDLAPELDLHPRYIGRILDYMRINPVPGIAVTKWSKYMWRIDIA